MHSIQFLLQLRQLLSQKDCQVVVSCLKQDPLVWETLKDPDFAQKAITFCGKDVKKWNLGVLAFLSVYPECTPDTFTSCLEDPLPPDLCQKAIHSFEQSMLSGHQPADLSEAALNALAIKERFRLRGTWQGIRDELSKKSSSQSHALFETWATSISCAYHLLPNPIEFLRALIPIRNSETSPDFISLCAHSILASPLTIEEQNDEFSQLLKDFPIESQMMTLSQIAARGCSELTRSLAKSLLKSSGMGNYIFAATPFSSDQEILSKMDSIAKSDPLASTESLKVVESRRNLAALYHFAGEEDSAAKMIELARDGMKRFEARLIAETAAMDQEKDIEGTIESLQKVLDIAPESAIAKVRLAGSLIKANRWEEAAKVIDTIKEIPESKPLQFQLALHSGEEKQIETFFQKEAGQLANMKALPGFDSEKSIDIKGSDLSACIDQLLDLGMTSEAVTLSQKTLADQSLDKASIHSSIKALLQNKSTDEAIEASLLGAITYPEEMEFRKLLATSFEASHDYQKAFIERQVILNSQTKPDAKDQLAFASTALEIGQPDLAISTAETLLQADPENGFAHTLIGKALVKKEDKIGAREHFVNATLSTPEQAEAWLELSKTLRALGDQAKSLETLRSAAHAVPDSSQIIFELGKASLESGQPSEGLPALREAFSLDAHSPEIAHSLGNTLYDLGHFDEADLVLTTSRKHNPNDKSLAFLHGQIQLVLGDQKSALNTLLLSAQGENTAPDAAILLAQTAKAIYTEQEENQMLKGLEKSASNIVYDNQTASIITDALQNLLQHDHDNFEAKLLLGESLLNSSQPQKAYEIFSKLEEDDKSKQQVWGTRVQIGFGKSATQTGQVDTAIASLQEAADSNPESIELRRCLTDALQKANLHQEALITAREVLKLAPESLGNLFWFAHKALELNSTPEAIQSLESASKIAPERADISLRLAKIYYDNQDTLTAKSHLTRLLDMSNLQFEEYKQAAQLLSKLQDYPSVIKSLEAAKKDAPELDAEFYTELAEAYDKCGNLMAACENFQKANELAPDEPEICMKQADIFTKLHEKQAAISSLEHALDISNGQLSVFNQSIASLAKDSEKDQRLASQIHSKLAALLQNTGKLQSALEHAKAALALIPDDLKVRSQAVELAYGLMEDELASSLAKGCRLFELEDQKSISFTNGEHAGKLLSVLHDIAAEQKDAETASKSLSLGLNLQPDSPRLLAQQAKKLAAEGDKEMASHLFKEAFEKYTANNGILPAGSKPDAWTALALAETALELEDWQSSSENFKQATKLDPFIPRFHARYAHAMIVAAENNELCKALEITRHTPAKTFSNNQLFETFEKEMSEAKSILSNPEIDHQLALGHAVFNPTEENTKALACRDLKSEDMVALISAYKKLGWQDEIDRLEAKYPEDAKVALEMAFAFSEKNPERSKALLEPLSQKDIFSPYAPALMAKMTSVNPFEAKEWIEKALEIWPDEIGWHKWAAEYGNKLGEPLYELEHWQKIVTLEPADVSNQIALGKTFIQCGQLAQAIAVLNDASRLDPERMETWKELANAYLKNKNFSDAIKTTVKIISSDPDNYDASLIHGKAALALNQIDTAQKDAETILEKYPEDAEALALYSQVLGKKGKVKEALFSIEKGLRTMQNPLPLLLEKASLIKQSEGNQAVLPHLIELTKNYPSNLEGISLLANTYSELGQFEAAEKSAQKALQLSPDDSAMHMLLGRIQRAKGQLDQSIHHLDEAIKRNPAQIDAYLELGKTYQDRRDNHRALRVYRQATQIAPEDFRPFYQAGLVFRENKDFINAESMFRRAAKLAPENVTIKRQLGAMITLNLVHNPQMVTIGHEY